MSSATDSRRDRLRFRAIAGPDREAHAAGLANKNLSAEGRAALLAPLAERLKDAHHRTGRDLDELVTAAEAEVVTYHWENVLRRAAVKAPAKAAAVAQLAERETAAGILSMAQSAADDETRHGVALGVRNRRDLEPDQRAAALAAIAEPHRARSWQAVSTLIGAKAERMRHQVEGPFGTRELASTRTLEACHEAQQYTDPGTGASVSLSDAAASEMLRINGYTSDIAAAEAA